MFTLRSAAEHLAAADSLDALDPIAAALGCDGAPTSLDPATRSALGIPAALRRARIARGPGTLRALLVEIGGEHAIRDVLAMLAARLSSRAPHLLWLVLAAGRPGTHVAVAAWSADRSSPRVVALLCDRAHVVESDAETLCALAAARGGADLLVHARWLELLGREALTRRFYRALERIVRSLAEGASGRASAEERRSLALLYVSRLLFLSFLETKGWLDGDHGFLARRFDACMMAGGGYQRRVLLPLFFGTLNTAPRDRAPAARAFGRVPFLNGGLFARTPLERRCRHVRFGDEELALVHGELLSRYRFTPREESAHWSEAAVDPEMLGKAFESLMASPERRSSGAFYTPQAIVERVASAGLSHALALDESEKPVVEHAMHGMSIAPAEAARLRARIARLRILDPSCGSGAFLVHALERLADLLRWLGDPAPVAELRRTILTRSIFGVDVNPTAVWLCELRLWLSVVIESEAEHPHVVPPLPNLDHHVRVGDALIGPTHALRRADRLGALRQRYARAIGARKQRLADLLEREERTFALAVTDAELARAVARRRDLILARRTPDLFGERHPPDAGERARLERLRLQTRRLRATRRQLESGGALPFSFASHFADVASEGGFDLVVGNPPWVRLHNIPAAARAAFREEYAVFRGAAWEDGAGGAAVGSGFAAQVDLAALFVERSHMLLRENGVLALLLPMKLWRSLAGGGVRRLLLEDARVEALEDWSESPSAFDAAVYPSLLIARRGDDGQPAIDAALHRRSGALRWTIARDALALDDTPGSPWVHAPADVRTGFDRLVRAGTRLHASPLSRPILGVKCGCNAAFIVRVHDHADGRARVSDGSRESEIEAALLRPLIRGDTVEPWKVRATEHIVWTHGSDGAPLDRLPPLAERWLGPWRSRLAARADARGGRRWWTLFRTEAAACDRPRVVWSDFGRTPRAAVLEMGDRAVPLNSCYVVRCAEPIDAEAFAALLNSPVAAAWLALLAEPARGGYKRYLGWTVARLPIPRQWESAREVLAPLTRRARRGDVPGAQEMIDAVAKAYRIRLSDIDPLLTWGLR